MEQTFYEDSEISVTSLRILVLGKSFPLGEVRAVEQTIAEPARIGLPIVAFAGCLLGNVAGLIMDRAIVAVPFLVGAMGTGFLLVDAHPSFTISVVLEHGTEPVIVSRDRVLAAAVLAAITQALAAHG